MQFANRIQQITLYLFLFSINFEMMSLTSGSNISVSKVFGTLYIISILPQYQVFFRIDAVSHYLIPLALFFGLLTFINLVNINEFDASFFNLTMFLNIILFWIMINHERKDYLVLEKGMLSFALGATALAVCFIFGIGVIYEEGRLWMFGDDPNYIASRIIIGILILVLAVAQNRLKFGWYRYLLLLPIPIMIKLLYETGSRLGFIAFVLSLGTGVILYKTKNIWGKLSVLIVGLVTIIIAGLMLLQSETMVDRLKLTAETGDTAGRTEIWQSLIPVIEKHPVFGVGQTGYTYQSTLILSYKYSPHNVILEILCYTGITGLFIYALFLYRIGTAGYISYKEHRLVLPLLLLIPIAGIILSIQILTVKIGWVIYAYIISTLAVKDGPQHKIII